jgi:hypothetical protein
VLKVPIIVDSLKQTILKEHEAASKASYGVLAILSSAGATCRSRSVSNTVIIITMLICLGLVHAIFLIELTMLAPPTILVNFNEFICEQMNVPFTFNICYMSEMLIIFVVV